MPNTYACKLVSNPNVPIFLPRVCTLVLFIIIVLIYTQARRARDIGAPLLKIFFLCCWPREIPKEFESPFRQTSGPNIHYTPQSVVVLQKDSLYIYIYIIQQLYL